MSQDTDFKDLPTSELWHHSSWKARQAGYDRVAADLASGAAALPPVDDLRAAVSDANAIALDSGIKLLLAACRAIPPDDRRTGPSIRQSVAKPLAEKGLGASKPAAKQNALEALLVLVEVADPAGVVDDVLPLLSQRAPKLVAAATAALARIFGDFGSPVTDPRPVLAVLPGLFGHSDRAVRAAASDLAVGMYRWVGEPSMMQILGQLKPVQVTELKALFAKVDTSAPVARLTRGQAAAAAQAQAQADGAAGSGDTNMDGMAADGSAARAAGANAGATEIDPWDLSTPEDVVSKISPDFWTGVQSAKWKERHESLQAFLQQLEKVLRLDPSSDYSQLVSEMLRIAAKDLNQLCATEAVHIITCLANGLRQSFQSNAPRVLEVVVERYKEKKPSSVETVTKCIDALFVNVLGARLQPVLEPILRIGVVHKMPTVKLESTRYLAHLLCETPTAPTAQETSEITPLAIKLMGDGSDPVRAAAANVLAALVKIGSQPSIARALETLDDHKKKRVTEAVTNITVKAQSAPAARPAPAQQGRDAAAAPRGQAPQQMRQPTRGAAPPSRQYAPPHGAPPAAGRGASPSMPAPRPQQHQQHQQHQQQHQQHQQQLRAPPEQVPSQLRAPTTPAPTRGPSLRMQANASDQDDVSRMSISSPSPPRAQGQGGRPSVSSTPKIVKRSLAATEFTPARAFDPHRRRLHSPAKPADAMDDSDDAISADIAKVARLKAELDLEQKMRRELEAKLATAQVEHEREVRRLSEKIATLKVELQSTREDFAVELQHSRRAAAAAVVDPDDVRGRLNTLNLDEQALRAPRARDGARSPTSRPHSMFGLPPQRPRLVPIASQEGRTSVRPQTEAEDRNRSGSEAWERAVTMTHDIRERVERLKARRQPDSLP